MLIVDKDTNRAAYLEHVRGIEIKEDSNPNGEKLYKLYLVGDAPMFYWYKTYKNIEEAKEVFQDLLDAYAKGTRVFYINGRIV